MKDASYERNMRTRTEPTPAQAVIEARVKAGLSQKNWRGVWKPPERVPALKAVRSQDVGAFCKSNGNPFADRFRADGSRAFRSLEE